MNTKTMRITEGNILKGLIGFAIPILIGNIFQQLYNVADTAIIGNLLGDDALAAVGASTPVYNLLVGLALGITNGFAVVIARHFGARRHETMRRAVSLTYILSGIVAVTLTVLGILGLHPLMAFLKTPDKIIADTESYMMVITVGFTLTIAYNMLAGMLRAIGNSRASLYFLVISTFINIGLDFLFVGGMGMGVAGAAYATVISQGVSVVLCVIYVKKRAAILLFDKNALTRDRALISDLTSTGLAMGMMNAIVSIGSVILQGAVNKLGTTTITAHSAARKIHDTMIMPLGTMSMSVSTFTSQNYGAGKIGRVKKGIRYGIMITSGWSVFAVIVSVAFSRPILHFLTGTANETVLSLASKYIAWNLTFYVILGVLLILRSSLQGVGRKFIPIMGSVVEFTLKVVAVFILAPWLGYFGICILEPIIWIISAVLVMNDYRRFLKGIALDKTETNENLKIAGCVVD